MVDIQPDQMLSDQQQQQPRQLNANALNYVQSSVRQRSIPHLDQQDFETAQSLNQDRLHSGSLQFINRPPLSAIAEADTSPVDERLGNDNLSIKYMYRAGSQRLDEPDYSQMNHVDPSSTNRDFGRQGSHQLQSNDVGQHLSQSSPVAGSQPHLAPSRASRELSEEDHLAEIENIFSYLADEEKDMMEPGAAFPAAAAAASAHEAQSSLLSRPSLRYRRDVHCPNLLIFNQRAQSYQKPAPVKRRLTLPSIIKYGAVGGPVAGRGTGVFVASNSKETTAEQKLVETIVIQNGVRKRLEEEKEYRPPPLPPDIDPVEEVLEPPKELPRRFRLESVRLTKKADLGSLPDVSVFHRLEGWAIPRQEAEMLCQQKREELQQLREINDQMRRRAVVLKIGDFKVGSVVQPDL